MMKGGMAGLMKQAQQMQEKMAKMQEELANMEITGQSGAGLVSVLMTGRHDVRRVSIDDSLMQEDKEVLEDLIAAAINDAVRADQSGKDGRLHRGHEPPRRLQDAVLIHVLQSAYPADGRRSARPAWGWPQDRPAHGVAPARARAPGGCPIGAGAAGGH